jgi:hypothetical protein
MAAGPAYQYLWVRSAPAMLRLGGAYFLYCPCLARGRLRDALRRQMDGEKYKKPTVKSAPEYVVSGSRAPRDGASGRRVL